jgi:membrane-bound lytic murein transglycosylase D
MGKCFKLITAVLLALFIGYGSYCHAEETDLDASAKLVVPTLRISLDISPQFNNIPHIKSPLTAENTFVNDTAAVSDLPAGQVGLGDYTLFSDNSDARKLQVAALYETHGFNKAVESHLNFYTKKYKGRFLNQLSRAGRYIGLMAEIFRVRNLPEELVFLPLIESGFNLQAYSPKKAAGPWQFIPGTAIRYGLEINWWVDERRDPVKSTIAAAEYLSDLYGMFGSWNLALAAYNAGEGKILKAIKRTNSNDYWALRNSKHIKRETKNYVPSYIAATAIALDPESFGFENIVYHNPLEYDEVVIDSPITLTAVAKFTDTDIEKIKELNPELRRWCTPPNISDYTLKIPAGTRDMFLYNLGNASDDELFYVEFYTVKKGDTIKKISKRFGVPEQAIIDLNSLGKKPSLKAGSKILIPFNPEKKSQASNKPVLKSKQARKAV